MSSSIHPKQLATNEKGSNTRERRGGLSGGGDGEGGDLGIGVERKAERDWMGTIRKNEATANHA